MSKRQTAFSRKESKLSKFTFCLRVSQDFAFQISVTKFTLKLSKGVISVMWIYLARWQNLAQKRKMIIFVSSRQLLSKNAIYWHFRYLTWRKWRMIFQKFTKFYILKAKHYTRIIWKLRKKLLSNVWQKCTKKMKGTLFPCFIITKRKMTILLKSIPKHHMAQNIKMPWLLQEKSLSLPRRGQQSTSMLPQLMEVREF